LFSSSLIIRQEVIARVEAVVVVAVLEGQNRHQETGTLVVAMVAVVVDHHHQVVQADNSLQVKRLAVRSITLL